MGTSTTIIAALNFDGGVVIGADSQASDMIAEVRWPVEKLDRVRDHPMVLGFSGQMGSAERARQAVEAVSLSTNTFKRRDRVRNALEGCLAPEYERIKSNIPSSSRSVWDITIGALIAYWAEDAPHILEFEFNGDCCFHPRFHAIGSGVDTAYAIYRTLGGSRLSELDAAKSTLALLRILRTCVNVEMSGVSEPFFVWGIDAGQVRKLSQDEIQVNLQVVDAWEEQERQRFLRS